MLFVILAIVGVVVLFVAFMEKEKDRSGKVGTAVVLMVAGVFFTAWLPIEDTWHERSCEVIAPMECFTNDGKLVYVIEANDCWLYKTKSVDNAVDNCYMTLKASDVAVVEGASEEYTLKKYSTASEVDWVFSFDLSKQEKYVFYVPEGSVIG